MLLSSTLLVHTMSQPQSSADHLHLPLSDPAHLHRTRSSYDSCDRCQQLLLQAKSTDETQQPLNGSNGTVKHTVPYIPPDAPSWVHALQHTGRYIDRTALYDMTGHILFDSLLSINGLKHFYYWMESDDHAERTIEAFSRKQRSDSFQEQQQQLIEERCKNGQKGPEARVAFNLGSNVCGHRGIVHGGLTATLIDEVSGASAFSAVGPCFTANLNVDYKVPLKAESWILLRSYVTRVEGRKAWIDTTVEDPAGSVIYAKGRALFIRPRTSVEEHMHKSQRQSSHSTQQQGQPPAHP